MPTPIACFVADVHIDNFARWGGPVRAGLNDRARHVLHTLADASRWCAAREIPMFVLGDLFHRSRPEPALIAAAHQALTAGKPFGGTTRDRIVLVGNHDQDSSDAGDNALAPFAAMRWCVPIDHPVTFSAGAFEVICVPFAASEDGALKQVEHALALEVLNIGGPRALALHVGIADKDTPPYLTGSSAVKVDDLAALCKRFGVSHVFSGDWHRHQVWNIDGVTIVQVGSLAPNRFPPDYEDAARSPAVVLFDDGSIQVLDFEGPRFYKTRFSQVDASASIADVFPGRPAYVKITARSDQEADARAYAELVRAAPHVQGVELEIDRTVERVAAKTATLAARTASSIEEAVGLYVQNMPVPDGVTRDEVRDLVLNIVKQSG